MAFSCYRKFQSIEEANEFVQFLSSHNIPHELVDDTPVFSGWVYFGQKIMEKFIEVRIRQEDFLLVNQQLENQVKNQLNEIDPTHYLFKFSDDELFDIVSKPDEWNEVDYLLAQRILKDRGRDIGEDSVKLLKKQRIKELARYEDPKLMIYMGYLSAFLGGGLGIIIGWILSTSKKTLPDGKKVFSFSDKNRNHGVIIFFVGLFMFFISLFGLLFSMNN